MKKGRLENFKDLELETQYKLDFQDDVPKLILPAFYLFGRYAIILLGIAFAAMFLGATCGCFSRTWTTYSIYRSPPDSSLDVSKVSTSSW